jgi:hypothetical protein
MSAALKLYEQLTEAKDDKTRARLIAEAFDELEDRFPQLADLATQGHVRESELRLQKEIELLRVDLKALEVRLTQAIHRQTLWVVGAVGAIVGLIRLLDAVLA